MSRCIHVRIGVLIFIVFLTALPSLGQATSPPTLYTYEPPSGVAGATQVYIFGAYFQNAQGVGTVTIGGVLAPVDWWSNGLIIVTVPYSAQTGELVVTTQYGSDSSTNEVNSPYYGYAGTSGAMAADFVILAADSPPLNSQFLPPQASSVGCQSVTGTWIQDWGYGTTTTYNLAQTPNSDGTYTITGTAMYGPGYGMDNPGPYSVTGSLDQTGTLQLLVPDLQYGDQFKILQPTCSHTSMAYYWELNEPAPYGTPPPSDWLTNIAAYGWNQDLPMIDSIIDCEIPTSETVAWIGFASDPQVGGDTTIGTWQQDLMPQDPIWDGRLVLEQGPPGTDGCWFQGSEVDWSGQVTGTAWFVDDPETYGLDYIGFPSGSISYYRKTYPSGCSVFFTQNMYVTCGSASQPYATHSISYPVQQTTVCSQKDTDNECKPY